MPRRARSSAGSCAGLTSASKRRPSRGIAASARPHVGAQHPRRVGQVLQHRPHPLEQRVAGECASARDRVRRRRGRPSRRRRRPRRRCARRRRAGNAFPLPSARPAPGRRSMTPARSRSGLEVAQRIVAVQFGQRRRDPAVVAARERPDVVMRVGVADHGIGASGATSPRARKARPRTHAGYRKSGHGEILVEFGHAAGADRTPATAGCARGNASAAACKRYAELAANRLERRHARHHRRRCGRIVEAWRRAVGRHRAGGEDSGIEDAAHDHHDLARRRQLGSSSGSADWSASV